MRFVKYHGMSDTVLDPSAEHILVEAVEDERRKCLLQVIVLGSVNSDDDWPIAVPETLAGFTDIEKTVIRKFFQSSKERPQPPVWFRIIS